VNLLNKIPQYAHVEDIEEMLKEYNLQTRFDNIQQKWLNQYEDWLKKMVIIRVKANLTGRDLFIPLSLPDIFEPKDSNYFSLCCNGQYIFLMTSDSPRIKIDNGEVFDPNVLHVSSVTIHWATKYNIKKSDLDMKYRHLIYS
jgi:hypothetical protein